MRMQAADATEAAFEAAAAAAAARATAACAAADAAAEAEAAAAAAAVAAAAAAAEEEVACPICMASSSELASATMVEFGCRHRVCLTCYDGLVAHSQIFVSCPLCRREVDGRAGGLGATLVV